nr:Gag-Pol polyprotein [Tanacetum cinerariifolium]
MTEKYFVEYTGIEYDRRVNKRLMQMQESKIDMGKAVNDDLVVIESSGTESEVQDNNNRSGNNTDADNADVRPIYNEEPMTKVQLTAVCNIFAIGQQHTEQPEIINEGRVDQYPGQRQVKSPVFYSSLDSLTNDYSKQSLESKNSLLKQTVVQFHKDFSRMEAHCVAIELKYQNQALKSGQHGQVLNDESNTAKIRKEIDVLETINIELEHKVANFRKENKTLKKHYKYRYDSIKITRTKTIEQTTSLLANNADLKAQIQEKVFAIVALKNDLRKLKGNGVDTKDRKNLDKMKEKGNECVFVGYSTQSRAYRVFNKRTRVIMESIHVNFDELPLMASDQLSSDPAPECQKMALNHDSLSPAIQRQEKVTQANRTVTTSNELDLLFSSMFDELLNGSSKVVSQSSAVSAADAPNQRQQYTTPLTNHTTHAPTCQIPTLAPTTKDHPLEQVIGNPSQSVRTRRQLESDAKMCMFALT